MEHQNIFEKFKEFIGLFDKSIEAKNFEQLNSIIASLDTFEEAFLETYKKRKMEGTFFTGKKISEFMITEVLVLLLNKKLKNKQVHIHKIDDIFKFDLELQKHISKILLTTSICDPACGSGEFLLNAAEIIYQIVSKLNLNLKYNNFKNQILKNLYGYDINEYALTLCHLKLFRWFRENINIDSLQTLSLINKNLKFKNSIINSNLPKYDIIIGNPPYGNILKKNEKKILKSEEVFYNDIYCAFLLKALKWSNEIISFLVPKSFLLRQSYFKFRNKFLSKANIIKIFDIGSKMFKKATNEVQIVLYEKKSGIKARNLNIYDYPNTKMITYLNQKVDSLRICTNLKCSLCVNSKKLFVYTFNKSCTYCNSETIELNRIRIKANKVIFQLIEKIEKNGDLNYLNPLDYPKMIRGEEDQGLIQVKPKIRKNRHGSCFFISARNDFSYYKFKKIKSFNIEEIDEKVLKGRNFEYYIGQKLLIKHNNIVPEAIYTEENVCFTSSIYSLLHNDITELKYLCAIMNSSLIQFYCTYAINNQKDTTINLNQYMIRHLPIIKPNNEKKHEISEKVDTINNFLEQSNSITNRNIFPLLREIDDSIFELYSITENEKDLIISDVKKNIKYFEDIYGK